MRKIKSKFLFGFYIEELQKITSYHNSTAPVEHPGVIFIAKK